MKRKHIPKRGWSDLDPQAVGEYTRLVANQDDAARQLKETTKETTEKVGMGGSLGQVNTGGVVVGPGLGVSAFEGGVLKSTIEPDGDVFFGSDISTPSGVSFATFVNEQYYNAELMEAGDLLIGDNSVGVSNVKYDASEGQLQFRFGQTVNVYMDTDGSLKAGAGVVTLDQAGIEVELSGSETASRAYRMVDANSNLVGYLRGYASPGVEANGSLVISSLDSLGAARLVLQSIASVTGIARASITAVGGAGQSAAAPILELTQPSTGAGSTKLYNSNFDLDTGKTYNINGSPHTHTTTSPLYDQTLGASAASINVYPTGNIPGTGKDLHIRIIARTDRVATADGINIEINDDTTGANYSTYVMWHNFDSLWNDQTPASNQTFAYANGANAPANQFAVYDLIIYDYASTTKNKEFQSRGGQRIGTGTGDHYIYDAKGSWLSTNAITKVELTPATGPNFIAGTRVTVWLEG